jgi:putative transposase
MSNVDRFTAREIRIARVLRPLGKKPMSRQQAETAGKLLGLHWTSVYRRNAREVPSLAASG